MAEVSTSPAGAVEIATLTAQQLAGLDYRNIGPHRGGRVVAVAGHPRDPMVFYFGACAGGVWKSTDGGTYWECISDGYLHTGSVGALAVAASEPNVIYAGTGEATIRGDVSHGDGVYRSNDEGKTWANVGLEGTRHIAKIRIHPQNPDLLYVAALGHAWGPDEQRGLFRSIDGGRHWEKVLYVDDRTGAIDLSLDPNNPRVLFCALWEGYRTPYSLISGGPGSALYRSTDGGDTWVDISHNEGMPKGQLGKVGVAVSPARPERLWALVEAEDGALLRSDNGGESWQRVSENADLRRRAWYYTHIFADPKDPDGVWVLNLQAWRSVDGGATFKAVPTPHGDNHDLWIDPQNPLRMIEGNDGGACVSFNGGSSWSTILNQPTAQFYHVTADMDLPYRVYGSQQDNTAISVPSISMHGAITSREWFSPGGGESGYIAVRPDDPNIQYAGDHHGLLTRHDRRTAQQRVITVWPDITVMYEGAESQRHRFNWTFPIFLSPHDPNVLYTAAERLFRSTDEGSTWESVSPDLTRNDPSTLGPSGGPITRDNTSAEFYATIFAALESPHEAGTFWVGSDDGLVHISRDGGANWENVTPSDMPEWALVSVIEVSPHDPATAYLAATRYKHDDLHPYIFKTNNYGKAWTRIGDGIPEWDFTRVIREDPECKGLLYAGTETGVYISFDDGERWERFQTNLPVCPIHDLILKDGDLIIGTHGRSFWILDDVTPLHSVAADRRAATRLFKPRDTIRYKIYEGFGGGEGEQVLYKMAGPVTYAFRQHEKPDGTKDTQPLDAGKNRPSGVIISYFLDRQPEGDITLTILDMTGSEVRRFTSKPDKPAGTENETASDGDEAPGELASEEAGEGGGVVSELEAEAEEQEPFLPKRSGMNRFTWNFRYENATKIPGDKFSEFATVGPLVPPGRYQVQLQVADQMFVESFEVVKDSRLGTSVEDLQAQYELGMRLRDAMSRMHDAVIRIRDARDQLEGWESRLKRTEGSDALRAMAARLKRDMTAIEEEFRNTKAEGRFQYPPPNVPTRLNQKLAYLAGVIGSADAAPTRQAREVFDELSARIEEQLRKLDAVFDRDIREFNEGMRRMEVPAIVARAPTQSSTP